MLSNKQFNLYVMEQLFFAPTISKNQFKFKTKKCSRIPKKETPKKNAANQKKMQIFAHYNRVFPQINVNYVTGNYR